MKIKLKNTAAYLVMIATAILLMLYLDGPTGSYLLIALLAALLISIGLCIYTKKALIAELDTDTDILDRGEKVTATVHFKKRGILPTSIICAELSSTYQLVAKENTKLYTSMFGRESAEKTVCYNASYFGKGKIVISDIRITDYLGIISFGVIPLRSAAIVKVYPDIPDTDSADVLLQSITQAAFFEDSEETNQSNFGIGGTPGYEHRKYEAGDSLRLINWKLSAKRDELYVRRLETSAATQQTFVLDKRASREADITKAHDAEENAVEAILAVSTALAKIEVPLKIIICFDSFFEEFGIVSPADVSELRYRFTEYVFGQKAGFPEDIPESAVIFTPHYDTALAEHFAGKTGITFVAGSADLSTDNLRVIARESNDIKFI